jgi:hypothetical protein
MSLEHCVGRPRGRSVSGGKEFGFFLQCHLPHAQRSTYADFQYLEDPSTQRLIQFYQGTVRGSQSLWQELLAIDKDYRLPQRSSQRWSPVHLSFIEI